MTATPDSSDSDKDVTEPIGQILDRLEELEIEVSPEDVAKNIEGASLEVVRRVMQRRAIGGD